MSGNFFLIRSCSRVSFTCLVVTKRFGASAAPKLNYNKVEENSKKSTLFYNLIACRDATIWVIAILRIAFNLSVLQYIAVLQYMIKFEKRTHHVFKTCLAVKAK